jgi:CRISPR-associated protein Csb1
VTVYRTVLEADLKPLAGALFQPAGFPDLGAAEFGDSALLVESAQSMANWLEGTTWDAAACDQVPELASAGIPYVRVTDPDGNFLSSSRLEAHRLASAYIMDGIIGETTGEKWLAAQFGLVKGRPLDYRTVARACFASTPCRSSTASSSRARAGHGSRRSPVP